MTGTPKFGFILEYVSDIETAKSFYTDVLGFKVERYHPTFVQFEHFAIASDESLSGTRATGPIVLYPPEKPTNGPAQPL